MIPQMPQCIRMRTCEMQHAQPTAFNPDPLKLIGSSVLANLRFQAAENQEPIRRIKKKANMLTAIAWHESTIDM